MKIKLITLLALLFLAASTTYAQAPTIFFTDLISGPNTGGENNNGTILTIYGKNFRATQGTSTVTIGGQPVAAYLKWGGRSKAASPLAQLETISVAIGALAASGTVVVTTPNGPSTCANTQDNCQFTVRAGVIKCVSTTGSDSNSGAFPSSCFATIPKGKTASVAGDITYVLNGVTASVQENFNAALAIINNTCSSPNPCALVAYPGAIATIGVDSLTFGIRNPAVAGSKSNWVISNFVIRGQTSFEPQQVDNYRIINNDLACPQGGGQSACMHTVQVTNYFFYGNYTHNVGDQHGSIDKFYHGNYYTTDSNHIWAGWNEVDNNPTGSTTQGGCRAIQFFSTAGSNQFDLHVFNNYIHNAICDGINFSTVNPGLGTVEAYNNIIFHVGTGPDPTNGSSNYSCIVAGSGGTGTGNVLVYNNTMYDCGGRKTNDSGALDPTTPGIIATNNIIYQLSGESYVNPNGNASILSGSNNIWFGLVTPPSQTTSNITLDPKFINTGTDFHLITSSPAVGVGSNNQPLPTTDYDGSPRQSSPSIGALELYAMGPLTQSNNTNFFKTPVGKTIALNGTHTWTTMQDTDQSAAGATALQTLDYNTYITNLINWNHNVTILWHKDLPHYCNWTGGNGGDWTMGPWQWLRTGPGNATDGGLKFDLTQFNQAFFDRLRARTILAQQNGIWAIVELFDGLGLLSNRCATDGYPLTGANNINGIDDGGGAASMTMGSPNAITAIQEAYVKKTIDTLNDLPNVIWEQSEEAPNNSASFWEPFMIDLIHTYEGGGTLAQTGEVFTSKQFKHPVLYATLTSTNQDSLLYNSKADAVAPGVRTSPTSSCGTGTPTCKVNINDSDHSYFSVWTDTQLHQTNYIWNNATNGNQVVFMDPYTIFNNSGSRNLCVSPTLGICPAPLTTPGSYLMNIRNNMGYVNKYLNSRMNLTNDHPLPSLASTGQVLANNSATGFEFLVYAPNGGTFNVNLSVQNGNSMSCEWLNPSSGAVTSCGTYVATSSTAQSFTTPFSGDSVLFLKAQTQALVTASISPSSVTFGNQAVGTSSALNSITLTNTGTTVMSISGITLTGINPTSFSTSLNTCGATLNPSSSCSISVTFNPTSLTSSSANLTFTTNAPTSPDNVPLSGTGALAGFVTGTGIISGAGLVHN